MRLKELAVTRRDYFTIDPRKITLDANYNLRDLSTPDAIVGLEQLAQSIRESGLRVPLLVRKEDDNIVLVQGHRRHAAIMILIDNGVPFEAVECIPEQGARSAEDRTLDLFLSNEGEPLTELEKAAGVVRLLSYGWSEERIADKLGRSKSYVNRLRAYEDQLPERVKRMVRDGEVAAATAFNTVRTEGAEAGTAILEDARADAEEEAAAEAPPATLPVDGEPPKPAPAAKVKKVTEKRIAKTREKRSGIHPVPKAPKAPGSGATVDALLVQVNRFLGKCMDGTYDNEEDEVPDRLALDAKELATTIKMFKSGFRQEAAE